MSQIGLIVCLLAVYREALSNFHSFPSFRPSYQEGENTTTRLKISKTTAIYRELKKSSYDLAGNATPRAGPPVAEGSIVCTCER